MTPHADEAPWAMPDLPGRSARTIRVGSAVVPAGHVPRVGEPGVVTEILILNGVPFADVRFETPHALHGSRVERIGADWLDPADERICPEGSRP